jgi:hypothetical protein
MAEEKPAPSTPAISFKRKKSITLSTLKFEVDKPLYVLLAGKLHEGKQRISRSGVVKLDSSGNPRKPPTLVEVIDMTTGEVAQIIAATIINTEISENYPNESYIGLGFSIMKQKRKEGREYDPYEIAEVDIPEKFLPMAAEIKARFASETKSDTPEEPKVSAGSAPPRRR